MSPTVVVLATHAKNIARSRWLIGYGLLLLLATVLLAELGGGGSRALLSLINVVLLLVPLMSVVFGTLYVYQSRDFTQLVLTQPTSRSAAYFGLYGGLVVPLIGAFVLAVGVPLAGSAFREPEVLRPLLVLLAVGILLVAVFTAVAVAIAVLVEDRAWGLGAALLIWLLCTVVYDGLILGLLALFPDRPLEMPVLGLVMLNPVDVARIQLLLTFDVAALLGYTGTVYERVFGTGLGRTLAYGILFACGLVPLVAGFAVFRRTDL